MELYRKVLRKDRTPKKDGVYMTDTGLKKVRVSPSIILWEGDSFENRRLPEFWLEQVNLGDLKFDKENASQEFIDGINYILNQLK